MVTVGLRREAFEIAIMRRNLSQKKLAEKLNISRSYLSEIVRGKRRPSAEMRERLLKYFSELAFDDLFTIDGCDDDRQNNL